MAIQETPVDLAAGRYLQNETSNILKLENTQNYLVETIEDVLRLSPPKLPWASPFKGRVYRGLFYGPTPIAYFFFLVSEKQPDLVIDGKKPLEWSKLYLDLGQEEIPLDLTDTCGITNHFLAYNTVQACVTRDISRAKKVISSLHDIETPLGHSEWLSGRAGALYLLRVLRKYFPILTEEIAAVNRVLIDVLVAQQPWKWSDRQYVGAVHGEIGILTQIILSDSSYVPQLEAKLSSLLDLQLENGNWPVVTKDIDLIHFCHGSPGFVLSLLAIRKYFPQLHERIDASIEKGRDLIWERGILKKEPCLCHGTTGNALAFEGAKREHFLAHATPKMIKDGLESGTLVKEDITPEGLLWGAAGRAWVWLDWEISDGKLILYSDV